MFPLKNLARKELINCSKCPADNLYRNPTGASLLAWINFNPSMDKKSYIQWSVWWNWLSILKFKLLIHSK